MRAIREQFKTAESKTHWSGLKMECAYEWKMENRALREKNGKKNAYKHVPHKDKPPQVVAKRNARERRRVQAVNGAFVRLRKAIPIQNVRYVNFLYI